MSPLAQALIATIMVSAVSLVGVVLLRALLLNFASGLFALFGALVCFWFEGTAHLAWFMAATAGMFIYIAAADLIPELHHPHSHRRWQYAVVFFLGVASIAGLRAVVPEAH